jgi:hypothetical protein
MLRLLITVVVLVLLAGSAPAGDKGPSRRGQIAHANERNKRAAKEAKRRASSAQQQAKWQVKDRRKEVKRMQADTVQSKDRSFTKAHKREMKERQKMAKRHKAVYVLDSTPDPNPDSTPKPKQRGMLGSAPDKKD